MSAARKSIDLEPKTTSFLISESTLNAEAALAAINGEDVVASFPRLKNATFEEQVGK